MKSPRWHTVKQQWAILILGGILGGALMMVSQGNVVDGLYLKQSQLTMQKEDLLQEIDHLQQEVQLLTVQSAKNITNPTLRNIKVTVVSDDPRTQLEVTKFIKANFDFLIGTQVRVFAETPTIITEVVDRKTVTVSGTRVALVLRTAVILNDTLYLTVATRNVQ